MKTYTSLKEAQQAQQRGGVFIHIHRVKDDEWEAYEPGDEVPIEYLGG